MNYVVISNDNGTFKIESEYGDKTNISSERRDNGSR